MPPDEHLRHSWRHLHLEPVPRACAASRCFHREPVPRACAAGRRLPGLLMMPPTAGPESSVEPLLWIPLAMNHRVSLTARESTHLQSANLDPLDEYTAKPNAADP